MDISSDGEKFFQQARRALRDFERLHKRYYFPGLIDVCFVPYIWNLKVLADDWYKMRDALSHIAPYYEDIVKVLKEDGVEYLDSVILESLFEKHLYED